MKLIVAGKDRSADLGDDIASEAAALAHNNTLHHRTHYDSVLQLRNGESMAEYLQTYTPLMRICSGLHIALTTPQSPTGRGPGQRLRRWLQPLLLRVFTHGHAYIIHQQATINELLATALELEVAESQRRCAALEARLAILEERCSDNNPSKGTVQ